MKYLILILILLSHICYGQYPNQAAVDSYSNTSAVINGSLDIGTVSTPNNISNLRSFSHITEIVGDLTIRNTDLASLADLSSLSIIHGSIQIQHNNSIITLDFENLIPSNTSADRLVVSNNEQLVNLKAPSNYIHLYVQMSIYQNPSLTNLSGLENLQSVPIFEIENNPLLIGAHDFSTLTTVTNYINIIDLNISEINLSGITSDFSTFIVWDNPSLYMLKCPDGTTIIHNQLSIYENDQLEFITGFNLLSSVPIFELHDSKISTINSFQSLIHTSSEFSLNNNSELSDLFWLNSNLNIGDRLELINNDTLSICNVEPVCNYLKQKTNYDISRNKDCCENSSILIPTCNKIEICNGLDDDCNGLIDDGVNCCPINTSLCISNTTNSSCNGKVFLIINGGIPPYNISWSAGGISNFSNNLCQGLYSVTIKEADSNQTNLRFIIN